MTLGSRRNGDGTGVDDADGGADAGRGTFLGSLTTGQMGAPCGRLWPAMGVPQEWHTGRFLGVMVADAAERKEGTTEAASDSGFLVPCGMV